MSLSYFHTSSLLILLFVKIMSHECVWYINYSHFQQNGRVNVMCLIFKFLPCWLNLGYSLTKMCLIWYLLIFIWDEFHVTEDGMCALCLCIVQHIFMCVDSFPILWIRVCFIHYAVQIWNVTENILFEAIGILGVKCTGIFKEHNIKIKVLKRSIAWALKKHCVKRQSK